MEVVDLPPTPWQKRAGLTLQLTHGASRTAFLKKCRSSQGHRVRLLCASRNVGMDGRDRLTIVSYHPTLLMIVVTLC